MQRVIQFSRDVGVGDTDVPSSVYDNLQAAQSSTERTDCEPVLMEEDTLTGDGSEYVDQDEPKNEEEYEDQEDNDETDSEDERRFEDKVSCVCFV